ncbi:hypothetical protein LUZ60_017228 [Juncus effusus]|nr:hypothetical protein LUZ60_017228 [Juncus effusus]
MSSRRRNSKPKMADDDCCTCCRRPGGGICSFRLFLFILSAVPAAVILSLERSTVSISYESDHWFHECAKWDSQAGRFLVSTMAGGGLAEVKEGEESVVVTDDEVAGNISVGIFVDRPRERVLVVYSDGIKVRYGGVGAYRLDTWERIFLTHLNQPGDEPSLADDVAVDSDGNSYITDAKSNKIWKLGPNGDLLSIIKNKSFTPKKGFFNNVIGLNGIIYHPNGFLLVIHTSTGSLFKIDTKTEEIKVVRVKGSLNRGDGLELMSDNKLIVAGTPSRLVESKDGWVSAKVVGQYVGPIHRIATSATVKDEKVYLNHLVGFGIFGKKTHRLAEAVFVPLEVN